MWDSIFFVITHISEPYKKKDLYYLLNSRLKQSPDDSIVLLHDINTKDKCKDCKDFRPWAIIKNVPEGIFLLKKVIDKFYPWIKFGVQENIFEIDKIDCDIFVYFNQFEKREEIYQLLQDYQSEIVDQEIRIENQCKKCQEIYPWVIIRNSRKGIDLVKQLKTICFPMITVNKFKHLYKHDIPNPYFELEKWSKKSIEELELKIF